MPANAALDQLTPGPGFQRIRQYWRGGKGLRLWQHQRAAIAPLINPIGKNHGLELSAARPLLPASRIRHQIQWAPATADAASPSTLVCEPSALPLPDNLMDLVIVHHLLEIAPEPHYLLGEAARVTADNGRLIILGWHPLGAAGLNRIGPARYKHFPYNLEWHPSHRLRDWLRFVDFEIERVDYCGLPFAAEGSRWEALGRRYNLPFGASYIISARRRQLRLLPLKPKWHPRLWFQPGPVVQGLCRQGSDSAPVALTPAPIEAQHSGNKKA